MKVKCCECESMVDLDINIISKQESWCREGSFLYKCNQCNSNLLVREEYKCRFYSYKHNPENIGE